MCFSWLLPPRRIGAAKEHWHELVIIRGHLRVIVGVLVGLGYNPKKGKAAFATHKHSFVKSNGQFCNRCKQVGHLEHNCNKMNKNKKNGNVPCIPFDSCYVLTKGDKGVHAKFVGTLIVGPKKKAIWVPKNLNH